LTTSRKSGFGMMLVIIVSCCCRRRSKDGWVTPKAAGAATAFSHQPLLFSVDEARPYDGRKGGVARELGGCGTPRSKRMAANFGANPTRPAAHPMRLGSPFGSRWPIKAPSRKAIEPTAFRQPVPLDPPPTPEHVRDTARFTPATARSCPPFRAAVVAATEHSHGHSQSYAGRRSACGRPRG